MTSPTTPPIKPKSTSNSLALADFMVFDAQNIEREQVAVIESASVQQAYQEALSAYVQAKSGQVDAIEDRLENLIGAQQSKLQQAQSAAPGVLSLPGTKRAWQSQIAEQTSRLQTLNNRLQIVREIKDHVGLHGSKIEELATDKLRHEKPGLVSAWEDAREAERIRQVQLMQEKKRKQEDSIRVGPKHSLSRETK